MFCLLVLLLYTAGLRLGEAMRLRLSDINWEERCIHIRETKFFKSRVVPLSPSMMGRLKRYVGLCQRADTTSSRDSPLFPNPRTGQAYSKSRMQDLFRCVCDRVGLGTRGRSRPRLHDLRHTFAVHRLENCYRNGEDVQSKLGLLSTYMGHVNIYGTQRYLTMTSELLQHASQRFEKFFHPNNEEEDSR